jgi:RTX calcium-binding nonapeptide repeat (4 copies)
MASFNTTVIARVAAALYDVQLGNASMTWANDQVNSVTYNGNVNALVQAVFARDFAGMTNAQVAAVIVKNVGITTGAADAEAFVAAQLTSAGAANAGATIVSILNQFAALKTHPVAAYNVAAARFNTQIDAADVYAQSVGTVDRVVNSPQALAAKTISIVAGTALGADVMRLTGGMDARVDFTNPANQMRGLDLDGDGLIETNGIENVSSNFAANQRAANFEIVDAYARNPLNHTDSANNYLGDLAFDGTGFRGDGISTSGNVVLAGLGVDTVFGGNGNDFLAAGGIAQGRTGLETLRGGRNADFFFAEFSGIDATDGGGPNGAATLYVDGGSTSDGTSAGNHGPQDQDWVLFEGTDDDEVIVITLDEVASPAGPGPFVAGGVIALDTGRIVSRSGETMDIDDIENFDASGNLYGFLNGMNVEIGGRAIDDRDATATAVGYNYGLGSSAQLDITGSEVANIIVAGYDNDIVRGAGGADILFGGNLKFLNNPNLTGIVNDGRDEIDGGAGNDAIVFEADNGIINGGNDTDTLFVTNLALGTRTAADMTTDNVLRFDLDAQDLGQAAGYGGNDTTNSQDQTNYRTGLVGGPGTTNGRVSTTNMESVIVTGMGVIDYKAAGTNTPELTFTNQQNQLGYQGNVHLRGTSSANTLYANTGTDVIEGRAGNDNLSGGDANDDFYFATMTSAGTNGADGVDVIHRQTDVDGDNIQDTSATGTNLFSRDFNIGGTSTTGSSALTVDLQTTNLASPDVAMTSFTIKIGTVTFAVTDAAALAAANSAAEVAALVNTAYRAIDSKVSAVAVNNTIIVTDTGGRDISDTVSEGYFVGGVVSNGAFAALATFAPAGTSTTKDRLIYKSYEDRLDNEGTDDDSVLGSTISLGTDAYAEDLVIWFGNNDSNTLADTLIAEDQRYTLNFTNLTTQDRVTVAVNGVNYTLQVGVDLDGNIIAAEDGVGDTQAAIQIAFLGRLNTFINTFMDDDTTAGAVDSAYDGASTLTLTQRAYNGEQTVFMNTPVVTLANLSGGEPASVVVSNTSDHQVLLLDFDGRNAELNETNVLFVGQEFISRAELSTALNAGGTQTGNEAEVIDVGPNNLQDVVWGTTTAIQNNTATNSPLSTVPNGVAVHGDDFLLGGNGLDTINGGTGDDRVEGSIGGNGTTTWDTLDGGKNFYAVQVLGEPQARVYILNKWEAANPSRVTALQGLTLSSVTLIDQSESGTGTISGVFDDTLQFSQRNFTAGTTRFTVNLNDFALNGTAVELRNDGAGTVGVDVNGDGVIDNWTKFTNFENIRTVSGTGNAVANDGQGNDTLDVTLLSSTTTGAGGISYDLTNGGGAGEVRYSADAILTTPVANDFPVAADYEALVIKVDGVENVLASTGADLLTIDETEAAKHNTFSAGLGVDRIDYQNVYVGDVAGIAQPTITIKVDNVAASLGGTDTVTSTAGRVGTTVAVDTLMGVEYIGLNGNTAEGSREDDLLDITAMTAGAVVSYIDGTVKDLGGVTHVVVQNLVEIENIWADGNDTVIVADADTMSLNAREDVANATPVVDVALATFMDFDQLKNPGTDNTRKPFATQTSAEIENVRNQNEFKWNLSKTGTGADSDTVDYSNANDNISVVVELDATKPNQFVLVDGDGATFYSGGAGDLTNSTDRIDQLISVERIVASLGESVLDLSGSTKGLEIKWSAFDVASQTAALDRDTYTVRISDLTTASPLQRTFVEYRDAGLSATVTQNQATWNRIEGSDNAEVVIMNSAHAMDADTFNLRGGANQVKYNELTKSITLTLSVTDFVAATPTTTGIVQGLVTFQDGTGAGVEGALIAGSQTHTIRSYTANNGIATGSLRIAASQDAEDTLKFTGLAEKLFLVAEAGTVDNQITVKLGSGTAQNSVVLTGFELVSDSGSLLNAGAGLNFIDVGADHDTVKVGNDAIDFDGTNAIGGGAVLAGATEISLGAIRDNGTLAAAGFDFDVLDVTRVTNTTVTTVTGALAGLTDFNTDEVVFGAINNINSALGFEAVVFTQATVTENGATYVLNTTANSVTAGAKTIALTNGANTLSFGGTVLENGPNNLLRAATDLNATTGVTVSITGTEAVNLTGGNGADSLTGGAGNDVLRGNMGNDTLNGNFVAEAREVHTYVISNPAGGAGETVIIDGFTVTEGAVIQGVIVANNDADAIGAAFVRQWNATPASFTNNASIASLTYDALTNALTFTFTSAAANVADNLLGAAAGTAAASVSAETVTTAYAARTESVDRYVFEATAALNGQDTILNYDASDVLDFRAFFANPTTGATQLNTSFFGNDLSGAYNPGAGNTINVTFNKATLTAADFGGTTGRVIANDTRHIFVTTGDANDVADATNNGYNIYVVRDSDPTGAIAYTVELIGSFTPNTELTNAAIIATILG